MKTLKFKDYLASKILDGSKVITWRLFDDKDLQAGDKLSLVNKDTGKEFAKAVIVNVRTKKLGEVTESDFEAGHEKYQSQEDMIKEFKSYYGETVNLDTEIKIIRFDLI